MQGTVALVASSFLSGCGSSNSGALQPANPQPVPPGPLTQASLIVTAAAADTIGPAFAGLSYEKSELYGPLFTASNSGLIGMFNRLGTSVLRIGGNSVDRNVWTPNGPGQTAGQIAPSDVDSLAAFVKAAGWQCLYGINLGGAATGATTPALAAAEVAYAAQQFGSSLLGTEIGNEPYIRGQAYLQAHNGAAAAPEFQKILDHRGIVSNSVFGALAHLQLGRAYAMEGESAKAKSAYEDFLTLLKDADPDIPILKQAKAEYAKLQ